MTKLRTMADSTAPTDIPKGQFDLVAGYLDGQFANYPAMRKRFPDLPCVPISVNGAALGRIKAGQTVVLDVETGDFTPASGAVTFTELQARGVIPVIYCNRATWPAVRRALAARKVPRRDRYRWIAGWTGSPYMVRGRQVLATQYADPPKSGGHYDASTVKAYWPGLDPAPATRVTPRHLLMTRRLTKAWAHRNHPVASIDRDDLEQLRAAISRVLSL